jgi:predicted ABC-type ATPase
MRVFAGPNGSGKSVLKSYLQEPLLGVYLNPDEIEAGVKERGYADLGGFGIESSADEVLPVFTGSGFLRSEGFGKAAESLTFNEGKLTFPPGVMNSYFASVLAGFLRRKLLELGRTFTFETVMSHPGKVEILRNAQKAGYRTYLYYVATDDPAINVSRVANRVALGGHPVPEDKIVSRYHKSLELLLSAIRFTNRAYIFDNSTNNADSMHTWLAEITDGKTLELKTDRIPAWFQHAVLEKIA